MCVCVRVCVCVCVGKSGGGGAEFNIYFKITKFSLALSFFLLNLD